MALGVDLVDKETIITLTEILFLTILAIVLAPHWTSRKASGGVLFFMRKTTASTTLSGEPLGLLSTRRDLCEVKTRLFIC